MGTSACRSLKSTPRFTEKQGQYLAFIYTYALVNRRPPAEADMQTFFGVTPPSVHRMVVELETLRTDSPHAATGAKHRVVPTARRNPAATAAIDRNLRHEVLVVNSRCSDLR